MAMGPPVVICFIMAIIWMGGVSRVGDGTITLVGGFIGLHFFITILFLAIPLVLRILVELTLNTRKSMVIKKCSPIKPPTRVMVPSPTLLTPPIQMIAIMKQMTTGGPIAILAQTSCDSFIPPSTLVFAASTNHGAGRATLRLRRPAGSTDASDTPWLPSHGGQPEHCALKHKGT
jgi:hypothetical protein